MKSAAGSVKGAAISVLVRGEHQARVFRDNGFATIDFKGFDDDATLRKVASEHDGVVSETPESMC